MRREDTAADTLPDAPEGRAQIAARAIMRRYLCGHLHESVDEAERCAKKLAARLTLWSMPSDYYLG